MGAPPRCTDREGGAKTETDGGPVGARRSRAPRRPPRAWVCDGYVDSAAGRDGDQASHRRDLSPRSCVAGPPRAGLDTAAAGNASTRTECGRGPALGVPPLARGKKNARRWKAWILFYDESGISQRPSIRRTWAPRGETPVLIHSFNWKKLLVCLAVGFRWDGRCYQVWFRTFPGSCNRHRVLAYLETLARHVGGRRVILIWDQLPAHKSTLVRDYLDAQRHWLRVEWLPGYAPELNPAEPLWGNIKGRELANRCSEDLADAASALRRGIRRVRRSHTLAWAFLRYSGLSF